MGAFVTTSEIMEALQSTVLGGAKVPHHVSYPVIRRMGQTGYLAVFVQTYDRELLAKQALRRPSYWYLADLTTGSIVRAMDCKKEDFCSAPFDRLYRRGELGKENWTKADVTRMYAQLDEIRKHVIEDGVLDGFAYQAYLKQVLDAEPSGQRNFYRELSSLK